jgi:hypothetical protein
MSAAPKQSNGSNTPLQLLVTVVVDIVVVVTVVVVTVVRTHALQLTGQTVRRCIPKMLSNLQKNVFW